MSRCIFCGYCELACPFDAITLGNEFEIAEYSRDDLIYTKDMLLAEPIKRVPVADPVPLRHARAGLQDLELDARSWHDTDTAAAKQPPSGILREQDPHSSGSCSAPC